MIEIAFTLPLFLIFFFGLFALGLVLNARTSLTISVGDALRWGVTRGNSENYQGQTVLIDVNSWVNGGSAPSANLKKLLYRKAQSNSESEADFDLAHVNAQVVGNIFPGASSLQDLPATYAHAIVYAHQYMRLRVGKNAIKYPCDDRPGCLRCQFLNPDAAGSPTVSPEERYGGGPPPLTNLYMRCSFVPDFGVIGPLTSLLGRDPMRMFTMVRENAVDAR